VFESSFCFTCTFVVTLLGKKSYGGNTSNAFTIIQITA
jgi:hypothetical protein